MKTYHRVSQALCLLGSAGWLIAFFCLDTSAARAGRFSEAGAYLVLAAVVLGVVLLHGAGLALALTFSKHPDRRAADARIGLALDALLAAVLAIALSSH
ncbi:hypothetical protein [Burkholderia perseverans]|uniref:hypothetical protein n=1 Tax=Burkholderia perseverans TaxID=2615214 RepID=UPI001FF0427D|nr:hypothetical protein [Burkholderia perseverans]